MSKKTKAQKKKRRQAQARRDRLNMQQAVRVAGSENGEFSVSSANHALLEIYWESSEMDPPLTPEGNDKASDAVELAGKGKYQKAIDLLTEVNAKEPGRASIIYNIAAFRHILDKEGTKEEYDATIDMLVRDYPDYFFGKTAYATRLISQDRLDEAGDILQPLFRLKRLHFTEFKALSMATVDYHLAGGNEEAAKQTHRAAVEVCGDDSFPPMESFHIRLLINRLSSIKGRTRRYKKGK